MADPQSPDDAGEPKTKGTVRDYPAPGIVIHWNATRCLHVANCVRGSSAVFDPKRRPWIIPDAENADRVAEIIRTCPTGALSYSPAGPEPVEAERPDEPTTIDARPNGPLCVRGEVDLSRHGERLDAPPRFALCRCGGSSNKPFCDNTHRTNGFED